MSIYYAGTQGKMSKRSTNLRRQINQLKQANEDLRDEVHRLIMVNQRLQSDLDACRFDNRYLTQGMWRDPLLSETFHMLQDRDRAIDITQETNRKREEYMRQQHQYELDNTNETFSYAAGYVEGDDGSDTDDA